MQRRGPAHALGIVSRPITAEEYFADYLAS